MTWQSLAIMNVTLVFAALTALILALQIAALGVRVRSLEAAGAVSCDPPPAFDSLPGR